MTSFLLAPHHQLMHRVPPLVIEESSRATFIVKGQIVMFVCMSKNMFTATDHINSYMYK